MRNMHSKLSPPYETKQKVDKKEITNGSSGRVPTLYEELHSLTFPDHARIFP